MPRTFFCIPKKAFFITPKKFCILQKSLWSFVSKKKLLYTQKSAGRWSEETRDLLNQFARGKVRHEPAVLKRRVQQAWRMRCQAILSCSAAKAFAASLLELRGGTGGR